MNIDALYPIGAHKGTSDQGSFYDFATSGGETRRNLAHRSRATNEPRPFTL